MRIGRWPVIGDRPSSARAAARSEARTPLHASRYDLTVGAWFRRYGLPNEISTVGLRESVTVMSCASESGSAMLPRPEIGRTPDANTTFGLRAITVRAESYDGTPDIGHRRKESTGSAVCRGMAAKRGPAPPGCSSADG